jgi:hypothetical protein
MLYPLSYEGLACMFAQQIGQVGSVRIGLAASSWTVCAVSVPRTVSFRLLPP